MRLKNPEFAQRQRDNQRRWAENNPERIKAYNRRRWENETDYHRQTRKLRKYGLSVLDYRKLLRGQSGVCAICKRPPKRRRLAVDHDHKTGRVRGLLCFRCNYGMSWFSHRPELFVTAAKYLEGQL